MKEKHGFLFGSTGGPGVFICKQILTDAIKF